MEASSRYDAIVVGGGHNGLVASAYLARAGLSTLLIEARGDVGGTAASEPFAGVTVNICNCDHLTFRTTPVAEELDLTTHGLDYLDLDPGQHNATWASVGDGVMWSSHRDVDAAADEIGRFSSADADAYRRFVADARPVVELIFEAAAAPPGLSGLTKLAARRRGRGLARLLAWSRRSAHDVLTSYFSTPEVAATGAVTGPMVWGISPRTPGTGLGAITHAMRHVATVGRPIGGSGRLTDTLRAVVEAAGGTVLTHTAVTEIRCDRHRVAGVTAVPCGADGAGAIETSATAETMEFDAPIVVSACNPHDTFLRSRRSRWPRRRRRRRARRSRRRPDAG
ncbi:MAG: NAD(P)/FAD-dependent oxidoreductase, partial [Actinomycetota bacterium]